MEPAIVVFVLPSPELLGELSGRPEAHAPVELVFIGPMAALDLAIGLRAARRDLAVEHAQIPQVPGEVGSKLRAMVGLDTLDGHRQTAADFFDELRGRLDGVVSIDPQHAIPGRLIDGGELVEAAAGQFQVLDIDLEPIAPGYGFRVAGGGRDDSVSRTRGEPGAA